MDLANIQAASQYVNSLLLARGLLRDGDPIDFAAPAKGGQETTVGNIINLVHDLVSRRDRENENLSSMSQSLQSLRTTANQHAQSAVRLEKEKAAIQRELELAKAQLRTVKLESRSLESKNKAYKEDIQRLRTSVGQIRAQCATDVRKRETEIARLKKHIDVQRSRDSRTSSGQPGGVTIIDPTTGKAHYPASIAKDDSRLSAGLVSLHDETNAHLSQLSAELVESNEALTNLVQNTIATLRSLQGLPPDIPIEQPPSVNGAPEQGPAFAPLISVHEPAVHVAHVPSPADLTAQLSETVTSLRSLLNEPSFVPVEEVEVREAELARLRAGWETMESRWREAVALMNGWQQRMKGGENVGAISMDDIRRGMELAEEGLSVAGSPQQRHVRERRRGSSISELSIDTYADPETEVLDESILSAESSGVVDDDDETAHVQPIELVPKIKKLRFDSATKPEKGAGLSLAPQVLHPRNGNSKSPTRRAAAADEVAAESSVEATPTPSVRGVDMLSSTSKTDAPSPDIWLEPEANAEPQADHQILAESKATEVRSTESQKVEPAETQVPKPVKRTELPRRTVSKRRSTLTPDEIGGLLDKAN